MTKRKKLIPALALVFAVNILIILLSQAFPQAEALTEGAFLTGPLTGFALEERCRSLPILARYRVLD